MPKVMQAPAGLRGFDCNAVVSAAMAAAFAHAGYRFAVRYIRRVEPRPIDLSPGEIARLHAAGLAVMPVQHVEADGPPWWTPTDSKGRAYGNAAAGAAALAGVPVGTTVWLDLEGIAPGTDPEAVIRYANYWHDRVALGGYRPGVYVGYGAILEPGPLYRRLKFDRYWAAGNLDTDQYPAVRGVCMRQHWVKPGDVPPGASGLSIDTDTTQADLLGGLPFVYAPDEWAV